MQRNYLNFITYVISFLKDAKHKKRKSDEQNIFKYLKGLKLF